MASSNRHWPSMFKSKPCNSTHHHQWHHDINSSLISPNPCNNKSPFSQGLGCDERTPEPKPRWNPRPEQIRILEGIFNSGMVNPPRDEIRKIRAQLQVYGQVGDANVFYWFQNRKSRTKHKQRLSARAPPLVSAAAAAAHSPSSSSSGKSSPNNSSEKSLSAGPASVMDLLNSPTASVNQPPFLHAPTEFAAEPFYFPAQQSPEFCFPAAEHSPNLLLSELMLMSSCPSKKDEEEKMKFQQQQISYTGSTAPNPSSLQIPTTDHLLLLQGAEEEECGGGGHAKSTTVFVNDVCLEVGGGPFNVREAFGDDAVLVHSSGQPVLTDEWGVTLHPLHHGAFYYLLRPFSAVKGPSYVW